jgi:hypothetical protein
MTTKAISRGWQGKQTSSFGNFRRTRKPANPSIITNDLKCNLDIGNGRSYTGTGATVTDLSGNSNDATLINTPAYSTVNNGVLTFNGTNTRGTIPGTQLSGNQLTVSLWIKQIGSTGGRVLSKDSGSGTGRDWIVQMRGSYAGVNWITWNTASTIYILTADYTLDPNVWTNMTLVWDTINTNTARVYLNGVLNTTTAVTGSLRSNTGQVVNIGMLNAGGLEPWNGTLASIRIYNSTTSALSDSEIWNNFNAERARFGV